jgi:phosphatidylglycerophosphatase C
MVYADDTHQGERFIRPTVAFDFDGTLTVRDSFTAFLRWRAGPIRYAFGMIRLLPAGLAYQFHHDRGRMKAAAARVFLGKMPRAEMESLARKYAEGHARSLFRPDAIKAWRRWQAQGARLIICTASPETLVAPFARGLGADILIGSRLAFDEDERFTGKLDGKNCRGPEKVRRLRAVLGLEAVLEAAYGDTSGDKEMLSIAEERGYRIFRGRPDQK